MSAERVFALTPACVECGSRWLPADGERWRLVLVGVDELAFYCPDCYREEFTEE